MDFQSFPKIPRLNRDIVVTEKIDGTNAAVLIEEVGALAAPIIQEVDSRRLTVFVDGIAYTVQAQSRKRLITPESDNHGFATWVRDNAIELVQLLGPGRHFGEWWGQGIQRGYGMNRKVFSLFNPSFHFGLDSTGHYPLILSEGYVRTVPVLYEGVFSQSAIEAVVAQLGMTGSAAASGFTNPEGIIIFHTASRSLFKVTCKDDEKPKGSTE